MAKYVKVSGNWHQVDEDEAGTIGGFDAYVLECGKLIPKGGRAVSTLNTPPGGLCAMCAEVDSPEKSTRKEQLQDASPGVKIKKQKGPDTRP